MVTITDIKENEWKLLYDDMSHKMDELSKQMSSIITTNISNVAGDGSNQNLRAAQDTNTRLTTDMDLLRKELTDLQPKNNTTRYFLRFLVIILISFALGVFLQRENTQLRSDLRDVQYHCDASVTALQRVVTKLEQDVIYLKSDVPQGLHTKTTSLQEDVTKLDQEVASLRTVFTSLQTDVSQAQGLQRNTSSRLDQLETQTRKLSTAVAFTAELENDITTTTEETLICDDIVTNIGGAYNGDTGTFTAPIAGVYCFMLSVSLNSSVTALAKIMHGERVIGYVLSSGRQWATGHVTVHLPAGGKVWLKTWGYRENTFSIWTHFTGMLVSPDV